MSKFHFSSLVVVAALTLVVVMPQATEAKDGNNGGSKKGGSSSMSKFSGNSSRTQVRKSTGGSVKNPSLISNKNLSPLKGTTTKKPNFGNLSPLTGNPTKLDPKVIGPKVIDPKVIGPKIDPGVVGPLVPPVGPIKPPKTPPIFPPKTPPIYPPKFPPICPTPPKHCPGFNYPNWCLRPTFCHWWWNYCPGIHGGFTYYDCSYDYVTSVVVVDGTEITVRYWLGVKGMVLPGKGFGVESVDAGSPAEFAGIRPGMVIVSANGIQITDDTAMQQAVNTAPNGLLALTLLDKADGQPLSVNVQMKRIVVSGF